MRQFLHQIITKTLISLILILLLVACSKEPDIDADDFGFPKINLVDDKNSDDFTMDTGYVYDGNRMTITVKTFSGDGRPKEAIPPEIEIVFLDPASYEHVSSITSVKEHNQGQNSYLNTALHITLRELQNLVPKGNFNLGYDDYPTGQDAGSHIYVHIKKAPNDKDNYQVIFRKGVRDNTDKIFSKLIFQIDNMMNKAIKSIYTTSLDPRKTDLVTYIRLMLNIYLIIICVSFIIGILQITNKELMVVLFKVSIITVLISEHSFDFFNNHFFVFFQDGVYEIINMMQKTDFNTGSVHSQLQVFDNLIQPYISGETFKKILTLCSFGFSGCIMSITILIAIFYYICYVIKAVMFFIFAKIAIAILIIFAPMAITASLFKVSKSIFDNWLKFLIGYALQPIFLIAGIALVHNLILSQFHKVLGYKIAQVPFHTPTLIANGISNKFYMGKTIYDLKLVKSEAEFQKYNNGEDISNSEKIKHNDQLLTEDAKHIKEYDDSLKEIENNQRNFAKNKARLEELTSERSKIIALQKEHLEEASKLRQYIIHDNQILIHLTEERIEYKLANNTGFIEKEEWIKGGTVTLFPPTGLNVFTEKYRNRFLAITTARNQTIMPTREEKPIYDLYLWMPDTELGTPQEILVPEAFVKDGKACEPYQCKDGRRYPNLPYLKLANNEADSCKKSSSNLNDQCRIESIAGGSIVTYYEMFSFLFLVYLFIQFNRLIPSLARELSNVSLATFTNLYDAVIPSHQNRFYGEVNYNYKEGAFSGIGQVTDSISRGFIKYTPGELYIMGKELASQGMDKIASTPVAKTIKSYTTEALRSAAESAIEATKDKLTAIDKKINTNEGDLAERALYFSAVKLPYNAAKYIASGISYTAAAPLIEGYKYREQQKEEKKQNKEEREEFDKEIKDPNAHSLRKTLYKIEQALNDPLSQEKGMGMYELYKGQKEIITKYWERKEIPSDYHPDRVKDKDKPKKIKQKKKKRGSLVPGSGDSSDD